MIINLNGKRMKKLICIILFCIAETMVSMSTKTKFSQHSIMDGLSVAQINHADSICIKYSDFDGLFTVIDIPCENMNDYITTKTLVIKQQNVINEFLEKFNNLKKLEKEYPIDVRCTIKLYEKGECISSMCLSDNIVCTDGLFYMRDDTLYKKIVDLFIDK